MAVPPIYPELIGLTFDVVRRPMWSTGIDEHVSGRKARIGYYGDLGPIYEWDLRYDVLRDFHAGIINSELKRLEGFFLNQQGRLGGFLFRDPDDWRVTGQVLPITSVAGRYLLARTFGDIAYPGASITEPIGAVNLTEPFRLYINNLLQPTSNYEIVQEDAIPVTWDGVSLSTLSPSLADWPATSLPYASTGNQIVQINSAPDGAVVTVDMAYYWYVRFGDDSLDFENFARQLWELKKVTLHSLRREFAVPALAIVTPPPPPPPSPAFIDGFGSGDILHIGDSSVSTSDGLNLTTAHPTDVIIAVITATRDHAVSSIALSPTVQSVTGGGLSFTPRGSRYQMSPAGFNFGPQPAYTDLEIWWAPATGALTDAAITATFDGPCGGAAITVFAVHGANSIITPWDGNGSLPAVNENPSGTALVPTLGGISTNQPGDLVLAFLAGYSLEGSGASPPWIVAVPGGGNFQPFTGRHLGLSVFSLQATAALSGSAFTGTDPMRSWFLVVDAIAVG